MAEERYSLEKARGERAFTIIRVKIKKVEVSKRCWIPYQISL